MPGGPQFQQPYGAPPPYGRPPGPQQGFGPPPGYPPGGMPPGPPPGAMPPGGMPPRMAPGPMGPGPMAGYAGPPPVRPGSMGGPPPGYGPPPGPGVVIDVGRTDGRKAVVGSIVAGAIGLVAVISGLVGAVDGGSGGAIVAIAFGVLFLLPALFVVIRRDKVFRPRKLVFEPAGLRWDDPQGAPWAVPWSELSAVVINKHSPAQVGSESLSDKLSGAATDKLVGERAHVRLDFYPTDPAFAGRHPELAHLWERQGVQNGYRLPLGSNVKFIPIIAQAMAQFAPSIYRGVNKTEGMMGLS